MASIAWTNTNGRGTNGARALRAVARRAPPRTVKQLMTNTARGTRVPVGGGAAVTDLLKPVPYLMHYQNGPVGFLQWYAKAYPALFKKLQKDRPDLVKAAASVNAAGVSSCPGVSSQLGALGSGTSWYDEILNYTGQALNLYGKYKAITSGQTTQQVTSQVQKQVQNAQSNLPPQQLGPVNPSAPAPSAAAVTTPGHSSGLMVFGGLGVGGLILAKLFHLF